MMHVSTATNQVPRSVHRHGGVTAVGLSLLELIVALMLTAMIITVVMQIMHRCIARTERLSEEVSRLNTAENALDLLITDIADMMNAGAEIDVHNFQLSWQESSHVTLTLAASESVTRKARQIDWVAVDHDNGDDLLLYRRDQTATDNRIPPYIPMCGHVESFVVELLDSHSGPLADPNLPPPMVSVAMGLYRYGTPADDHVIPVHRLLTLRRLE